MPTAALVVPAILLLGPPLGRLLYPAHPFTFWTSLETVVLPEPTEQARFLISLTGPLLLAGLTILLTLRAPRLGERAVAWLRLAAQLLGVAFVVACFLAQRAYSFGTLYTSALTAPHTVYFRTATLVVAAALAAVLFAGLRVSAVRERFTAWTAESRPRAIGAALVAVAMIVVTLLPAITTDGSVMRGNDAVVFHLQFTYDEAFAVLNGRSPIGDFAAQYGSLWPYVMAAGMSLLGMTPLVFTLLMATVTGLTLLGLFGVLRRLTRSSVTALLLFLPLLATSAYVMRGPMDNRYSLVNYFATFPLRYAGPFLLAWLTARHLDGARPRAVWPLFLLGGLAALNNTDFGIAAIGATLAALLWSGPRPTFATLRHLGAQAAAGLAAALALVTMLLLVRTGEAPHFALLFRYARLFAVGGFAMLPMRPAIGVSTVIYLTYVAAIGTATVRALRGEPGRLLTGMLAWSGIFGLGAGAYYMGRSHPEVLTNMFPAWALAVTLLVLAAAPQLGGPQWRRSAIPAFACLFAFGILVCSLAQTPTPSSQLHRMRVQALRRFERPRGQTFVERHTRPGEHVVILLQLGHRMAVNVGIDDVTPYTGAASIFTREQLDETVQTLRAAGGHKVFLWDPATREEMTAELARLGFLRVAFNAREVEMWRDGSSG